MRVRLPFGDYPEEEIPEDLEELTRIGEVTWEVEAFGIKWYMVTLKEWEARSIARALSGLDGITRERLSRVEYIQASVYKIVVLSSNKTYDFSSTDSKKVLRSILLSADEKVVAELYTGYLIGALYAEKKFRDQYPSVGEELKKSLGLEDAGAVSESKREV